MESQYEDGISIIMPVHNNEKTLEKCIKSIKRVKMKISIKTIFFIFISLCFT